MADFDLTPPYDESTDETDSSGMNAAQIDPVWGDFWNPHPNAWAPSVEDFPAYGHDVAEVEYQSHGDVPATSPMTEQYGLADAGGGSVPDARANLRTNVRDRMPIPYPTQTIRHELITQDVGSEAVRARTVIITSNLTPVTLLDENPNRKRALIKVITSTSIVMIIPLRSGGGAEGLIAAPTSNAQGWAQATGDPVLEVKAQAGVECYGVGAAANGTLTVPIAVTIWEELIVPNSGPGLTGA